MDFSLNPNASHMHALRCSKPARRLEALNPGRITFNRMNHKALVASNRLPIKAVTQVFNKKLLEVLLPYISEIPKLGFVMTVASVVCSVLVPWIVVVFLHFRNLGVPVVGKVPIDRSEAAQDLLNKIKPGLKRFYFLYGSHATGKSTLVRSALGLRKRGSIYVLIEDGIEISLERLAMKIFLAMNWLLLLNFNVPAWIRLEKRFEELFKVNGLLATLAQRYEHLFKENLMLVLDGANSLPQNAMMDLLGMAKNLADTSPLLIVLVGTAGQLPHVCLKTSALSRGTFIVIPTIPDKDLKAFVLERHEQIPPENIDRLLNLVGGKCSNLDWCIELMNTGASIESVETLYEKTFTYNSFALSGLFDLENNEWVRTLYKEMNEAGGELDVVAFQFIVPREQIWRLNAGSVFSIDEMKMVRYESKANEQYALDWLSSFDAWTRKRPFTKKKGSKKNKTSRRVKLITEKKSEPAPQEPPKIE